MAFLELKLFNYLPRVLFSQVVLVDKERLGTNFPEKMITERKLTQQKRKGATFFSSSPKNSSAPIAFYVSLFLGSEKLGYGKSI